VTQHLDWYAIRASGIVAWALVTASVLWGLVLSSHSTRRVRPAWVRDLHRFLAGLAIAFVAVHVGGLLADSYIGFSPAALVVPFASTWRPAAVTWGIVACDALLVVEITSLLMTRLSRRLWHAVHLLSFGVFAAATIHGLTAGTDAGVPVARVFAIGSAAAVFALTGFRLVARHLRPARRAVEPLRMLPPPTLRPIEEAIAEVRRGATRSGGVAARVVDTGAVPRGARR
jgi:methionine sulfoxide reductase heme-binding subunit